mgnify:CR=1 FL=1
MEENGGVSPKEEKCENKLLKKYIKRQICGTQQRDNHMVCQVDAKQTCHVIYESKFSSVSFASSSYIRSSHFNV